MYKIRSTNMISREKYRYIESNVVYNLIRLEHIENFKFVKITKPYKIPYTLSYDIVA